MTNPCCPYCDLTLKLETHNYKSDIMMRKPDSRADFYICHEYSYMALPSLVFAWYRNVNAMAVVLKLHWKTPYPLLSKKEDLVIVKFAQIENSEFGGKNFAKMSLQDLVVSVCGLDVIGLIQEHFKSTIFMEMVGKIAHNKVVAFIILLGLEPLEICLRKNYSLIINFSVQIIIGLNDMSKKKQTNQNLNSHHWPRSAVISINTVRDGIKPKGETRL